LRRLDLMLRFVEFFNNIDPGHHSYRFRTVGPAIHHSAGSRPSVLTSWRDPSGRFKSKGAVRSVANDRPLRC
jgi:hypothetical protein